MSKGNQCYYCGAKLNDENRSKEHVPPKLMFRAFNCDSITVPSCTVHNSNKSNVDQAIIAGFIKALNVSPTYALSSNVAKAIACEKEKSTFETTSKTARLTSLIKNPSQLTSDLPHVTYIALPQKNLSMTMEEWIKQLTAGLIYDAIKAYDRFIRWYSNTIFSPNWLPGDFKGFEEDEALMYIKQRQEMAIIWEQASWVKGWSSSPRSYPADVYRFYICFLDELICFKHVFYHSFTWYIGFECSNTTRRLLNQKVLKANNL